MRRDSHRWQWLGPVLALSLALALGACEDDTAKSETLTPPAYSPSGQLDSSFGSGGIVAFNYSAPLVVGDDRGFATAMTPGDGIAVGGYVAVAGDINYAAWRFTSIGAMDASFNGSGQWSSDLPNGTLAQEAFGIAAQSDGKLVLVGDANNGTDLDAVVWRMQANGNGTDTTFNSGVGYVVQSGGFIDDTARAVALDSQERIVAVGYSRQGGGNDDLAVWRFLPNGTLDGTFNSGAPLYVNNTTGNGNDRGFSIAIDSQDRIVVGGVTWTGTRNSLVVWRITAAGALDATFATGGMYVYPSVLAGADQANGVAIDAQGRIIAAGILTNGPNDDFGVIRLSSVGVLDTTFGTSGVTQIDNVAGGGTQDAARGVVIDAYGRILLVGESVGAAGQGNNMALVRLKASGALDADFGTAGIATNHNAAGGVGDDFGTAVAIDSAGRIVVTGYSLDGSGGMNMVLWRYR